MKMPARVEFYAGHRGEETPRRLRLAEREVIVVEVVERCQEAERRGFLVRGNDGLLYRVTERSATDDWDVTPVESVSTPKA
jgi:hypothetical protein